MDSYNRLSRYERESILGMLLLRYGCHAGARAKVEAALAGAVPTTKLAATVLAERKNQMGMGGV